MDGTIFERVTIFGDVVGGDKVGGDKVGGDKIVNNWPGGGSNRRTILVMGANPIDTDPLRLEEERRAIDLAIANARNRLVVQNAHAVRLDDLQSAMRCKPVIVHFCGHGAAPGIVVVSDDSGAAAVVPPHALSNLFGTIRDSLQCVVLNACFTVKQAYAIADHVPCVVGMRRRVLDDAAIWFAAGFYEGVADGASIREAFERGRNRLQLHVPRLESDIS